MDCKKFEGDTKDFSEKQLQFISKVLENLDAKCEIIRIEPAGKVDDNYIANVKRICAEKNGEPFNIIAKLAPKLKIVRVQMNARALFNNEHIMYTEILPKLTQLEKSVDIPRPKRFRYAECYGNLMEEYEELILLEDLSVSNYTMLDKIVPLNDDCIKLVLENFAALHAFSFALRNIEPETFMEFKTKVVDPWKDMDRKDMRYWLKSLEAEILEIVGDKYREALKGLMSNYFELINSNHNIDKVSKYSVIQQGDSWTNNIMFKMQDKKPTECCLIDYQLSREGSPATDLQYMLFGCTDYESRKKHFYDWIDYYHTKLDKALSEYGLKANGVYPRDQLDVDMRRCGKMSMVITVLLSSILVREIGDAEKMKDSMSSDGTLEDKMEANKLKNLGPKTLEKFKTRVEEIIDSYMELGYL